jgi:hypothetical protein
MSMASLYFLPSVVLLIVLLITVPLCFLRFLSLRKYRRKRNLLVYIILVLMLSLLAFEAYDQFVGPAMVSITLAGEPFFANRVNPIEVTVENLAGRETSFYLVLNSANATLTADSLEIIQLNSTAVKIPFNLHSLHEDVTKTVHFQMDNNVTGCIFYQSIERSNHGTIVTGGTDRAESVWNNRTGRYTLNPIPGAVI